MSNQWAIMHGSHGYRETFVMMGIAAVESPTIESLAVMLANHMMRGEILEILKTSAFLDDLMGLDGEALIASVRPEYADENRLECEPSGYGSIPWIIMHGDYTAPERLTLLALMFRPLECSAIGNLLRDRMNDIAVQNTLKELIRRGLILGTKHEDTTFYKLNNPMMGMKVEPKHLAI